MAAKVDEERDKALLQEQFEKWRLRLRKKQDSYIEIGRRHDLYLLRVTLMKWKARLQGVQVVKWRDDMRRRMSVIKARRDERILEDVWTVSFPS